MTTRVAVEWLTDNATGVPAELLAEMQRAVRAVPSDTAPQHLAAAALYCLRLALPHCDEREAALPLLAADALMTAACECAALDGEAALAELCAAYAPERLAEAVPLP